MVAIREHFKSEGPGRESEWARQRRWFIKARHDHQRREEVADKLEQSTSAAGIAAADLAPPARIVEFESTLTTYDTATVAALLANEEKMAVVQSALDALLAQAFVMDDGRRVFITEDGTQVFDEFGTEVSPDELDFDMIPDSAPKWETYAPHLEEYEMLDAEKQALLDYQRKLDDAREAVAAGDKTLEELETFEASLAEDMPQGVRDHLPTGHPAKDIVLDNDDSTNNAKPVSMDLSDFQHMPSAPNPMG